MHILYMVRSKIYLGRTLSIFKVRPSNGPDAIGRTPDNGRKTWSKIDPFSKI